MTYRMSAARVARGPPRRTWPRSPRIREPSANHRATPRPVPIVSAIRSFFDTVRGGKKSWANSIANASATQKAIAAIVPAILHGGGACRCRCAGEQKRERHVEEDVRDPVRARGDAKAQVRDVRERLQRRRERFEDGIRTGSGCRRRRTPRTRARRAEGGGVRRWVARGTLAERQCARKRRASGENTAGPEPCRCLGMHCRGRCRMILQSASRPVARIRSPRRFPLYFRGAASKASLGVVLASEGATVDAWARPAVYYGRRTSADASDPMKLKVTRRHLLKGSLAAPLVLTVRSAAGTDWGNDERQRVQVSGPAAVCH